MALFKTEERMVDALEDGRIVRVSESYARREGLVILQRPTEEDRSQAIASVARSQKIQSVKEAPFEALRKPLPKEKNNLVSSLLDNFHWILIQKRKDRRLSRRQVAESIGASESEVKMLENGVLPSQDYILVNKIEKFYGVNLRKDGAALNVSRSSVRQRTSDVKFEQKPRENSEGLVGSLEIDDLEKY